MGIKLITSLHYDQSYGIGCFTASPPTPDETHRALCGSHHAPQKRQVTSFLEGKIYRKHSETMVFFPKSWKCPVNVSIIPFFWDGNQSWPMEWRGIIIHLRRIQREYRFDIASPRKYLEIWSNMDKYGRIWQNVRFPTKWFFSWPSSKCVPHSPASRRFSSASLRIVQGQAVAESTCGYGSTPHQEMEDLERPNSCGFVRVPNCEPYACLLTCSSRIECGFPATAVNGSDNIYPICSQQFSYHLYGYFMVHPSSEPQQFPPCDSTSPSAGFPWDSTTAKPHRKQNGSGFEAMSPGTDLTRNQAFFHQKQGFYNEKWQTLKLLATPMISFILVNKQQLTN